MEKLLIIPTYNEKENVASVIETVFSLQQNFHILIIDDNSPDGTGAIVRGLFSKYNGKLFLEEREGKLGLGTAYILGFRWAISRGYQYIFEMDCDFSHDPHDLDKLYKACKYDGADVAVGSRYVKGGNVKNWPSIRVNLSKGASIYTRLITFMPVKDPTAGFVCYTSNVLEAINLDEISFVGYAFQIEMKFAAWKLGFIIKEVPITFIDRKYGISKMNKGIVKEGIFGVLKLKWMSMFKNYRSRVKNINENSAYQNEKVLVEGK
ncbi:polyprenol monophosphomannose synthase [Ginsengibacter hankyongi]|uniref:Polyprenol monophosphomannose synthase n=1 Tax=Ginsengibacter hankyongi TaxID=2607284 RepID=A0A5J5IKU2_9BACT|nr:polyprenol monophosphomannose synthase [Ginsengibacter hankyongi]KAA9041168.1 polyprenol monophosphomannose synthase [Ginsengibacter hankyongi]